MILSTDSNQWTPSDALKGDVHDQGVRHAALLNRLVQLADQAPPTSDRERPEHLRADRTDVDTDDVAVVNGQGRWRYGVVTKTTPAKITVAFLTTAGLDKAQRTWTRDSKPLGGTHYAVHEGRAAYGRALAEHAGHARLAARDVDALVAEIATRFPDMPKSVREYNENRERLAHAFAVGWLTRHPDASAYAEGKAVRAYTDAYVRQAAAAAMTRSPWAVNAALAATPRPRAEVFKAIDQS